MKIQARFWVFAVLCIVVWPAAAQTKAPLPFVSAMQTATYNWRMEVPALQSAANESAEKLLAGGTLYVVDTQKSFQVEVLGRAGGLMMVKTLTDKTALTKNDVILAALATGSDAGAAQKVAQRAAEAGAGVLWFAGPSRVALENIADAHVFPKRVFSDLPYAGARGVESVSNIIGVWTWMAALVSASVQRGKMPTIYTSNFMPDAMERNAQFRKKPFHETTDVTVSSLDHLPQRYLDHVANALYAMQQTQSDAFAHGAQILRAARNSGHQVIVGYLGHMYPYELNASSQLNWKNAAKYTTDATVPPELQDGDTLLFLGYQWFPYDMVSALQARQIKSIITSSRPPLDKWKTSSDIVYINPFWSVADAELSLRGYDIDILPISGVMQGVVYWQLAELVQ